MVNCDVVLLLLIDLVERLRKPQTRQVSFLDEGRSMLGDISQSSSEQGLGFPRRY